jgi:hypothetical protein
MRNQIGDGTNASTRVISLFDRMDACLRLLCEHLAGYVSALKAMQRG